MQTWEYFTDLLMFHGHDDDL